MLPQFKPVMALTIIAGVAFGGETGFLVGAMTMLASNVLFFAGPWTPFQMFSMGIIGFLAGVLFRKGWLRRSRGALAVFGGIVTFVIYGAIMNPVSALIYGAEMNWQTLLTYYITGFPHGLCSRLRHGDLPAAAGGAYAGKAGPHQGQIRAGGVIQRSMDTHRKAGASVTDAPAFCGAPQDPHEVHVKYKMDATFSCNPTACPI